MGGGTVAFAWAVATLITTQTIVMSVTPGSLSVRTLLPRASSLIASRDHLGRAVSVANPSLLAKSARQTPVMANAAPVQAHTTAKSARLTLRADLAGDLAARIAGDVSPPASYRMLASTTATSLEHPVSAPAAPSVAPAASLAAIANLHEKLIDAPVEQPLSLALANAAPQVTDAFVPPVQSLQHPISVPADQPSNFAETEIPSTSTDGPVALPSDSLVAVQEEATALSLSGGALPIERIPLPEESPLTRSSDLALNEADAMPDDTPSEGIPLPVMRPRGSTETADLAPAKQPDDVTPPAPAAAARPSATQDDRPRGGFLARLFGGNGGGSSPAGRGTAVYDIAAATVYLPTGERLEAHSGLGHMRDNPRFVHAKNTGPTPPSTYRLSVRESLFHGVEALRLTPVSGGNPYGRVGLLAHTYMLGPGGNSNGCIVFKDYRRFLRAYKNGDIKNLIVVARTPAGSINVASR
jgi:hypothetical protein